MEKTNYLETKYQGIIPYQIEEGKKHITLAPGVYQLGYYEIAPMCIVDHFMPLKEQDSLIRFKDSVVDDVVNKVDKFFSQNSVDAYKELKLVHKMGMIIHGPHGTGKTSSAMLALRAIAKKYDAICLDCTPRTLNNCINTIKNIRQHQKNPIIMFMDEFEVEMREREEQWLPFLDGTGSFENFVFIACTNYIDKIPDRIKDRKSRIKHIVEIKGLPMTVYSEYIKDRLPNLKSEELAEFAFKAENEKLTIDQVKNALIDYRIEGWSIDKAIKVAASIKDESI